MLTCKHFTSRGNEEQIIPTNLYIDSSEIAIERAIEFELKLAGLTDQEWLRNLTGAQADFARELNTSYGTAARAAGVALRTN